MSNKLQHISFIMDGNNRWSKKKNISKYDAYNYGANKLIKLTNFIFLNSSTKFVSAFALSRNNLQRSKNTINIIKNILDIYLDNFLNNNYNFNIRFIGDFSFLNPKLIHKIEKINSYYNKKKFLNIFLNYGGKEDIEHASLKKNYSKDDFIKNLSTYDIPDPDILIRSGGYNRLSNFLLYQLSFTELFFSKKLWPEFTNSDLKKIIIKFNKIDRKFGK